ncbi:porin [Chitinibacter fontanus]|uniref:Porin n=1 Tax=Chitinibacter fontanus TaxID=1737446 RepID=A0A7D5ZF58_9NEIS|nr:porin [Chitinibacter fontanus]QLI81368.1 porin [Chitinibacter fontanus]
MKPLIGFLATALIAGFAQAEVSVSGTIDFELGYNYNGDKGTINLIDNGSIINFKGQDKLDNGSTLGWELSSFLGVSDNGTFGSRKAYISYATDLGKFTFGRDDSIMRMAVNKYDIFEGYTSLGNVLERGAASRPTNQIKYVSPRVAGLVASAGVLLHPSKDGEPEEGYAAALDYKFSDLINLDVAFSHDSDIRNGGVFNGKKRETIAAGINGEFADGFAYGLRYSDYMTKASAADPEVKAWAAGGTLSYTAGKNSFRVGYVYNSGDKSQDGMETQLALLGYTYNLSKQSYIYTELTSFINGANKQNFGEAGNSLQPALGDNSTTLAVGLVTNF